MLNKIIEFSLDNRFVIVILSIMLLIGGTITASRMEVDVFPDLTAPTVVVMTEAPSMATEEVEKLVTFPLETAVNGATGVRRVRSNTMTGFSVVTVEFDWGTNIYTARQIVAEKISGVALPSGAEQPVLAPQSSLLGEVMVVGLTSDSTSMEELRTIADWSIRPRLLSTGGVAQVTVVGGDIKEYQIILKSNVVKQLGITLDEILAATASMNDNATGGIINEWGNEYIVRGLTRTTDTKAMGETVVKLNDDLSPITLADIADIQIGSKLPKMGDASVMGKQAVRLSITKQPAVGTIELTEKLDKTLEDIARTLPADVRMNTEIFRQAKFIQSSIDNIKWALFEGGILVIIILMVFLGNARTTIISLLAIPLSLLFSIIVLKIFGFSLNTMSLGGMAIAIGSLVDDAIIDVENVFKRLRERKGENPLKVIYDASVEIRSSIWNATLIIMVTFLPLFFLSGMEGRMLQPLGIAFIVSLFASMVVAITLTPVLSSYLLVRGVRNEKEVGIVRGMKRIYGRSLSYLLDNHKKIVVITTGAIFVLAAVVFMTLGRNFLPPFNEGSMAISVSALPGISLEGSRDIATLAEKKLMELPEVVTVSRKTGRAEMDEHALGTGTSEIDVPFVLKDRSRAAFFADVRERLASIKGIVFEIGQPISHRIDLLLSGTRANIAIKIFGDNLSELYRLGNEIKEATEGVEGWVDVVVEQQIERPELLVKPNRTQLAAWGITPAGFNEAMQVATIGQVVSQVYENGRTFDITLKENTMTRQALESVWVDGARGKVQLGSIATVESGSGFNTISRENVSRKLVVSGNVEGSDLRSVVGAIREIIAADITLPEGYHVAFGGQAESEQAASRTLLWTSLFAILVVFMLLYREFKKMSLTLVVMLNLPLAIIGGIFAVWATSGVISIPSIIGFISLFGIATRNGILLVSRFEHLRGEGVAIADCIKRGAVDRISPIVMTALTSGLALIPLALGGELPGNEIQSPLAVVILGGLLTSTLLNLFVVPVAYFLTTNYNKA
ncbi:Cobalt-zinc-cadmium resistance protein CzcA/Cation efflux system protein CusA [Mucinivorans hirudinis]|uniref:Cobalt-zinc-cadmium resistance protein CzcA/Cation efflux system protein CusA n=1 Tax=Mucinivorans hirudinis TaxID=1433126 RepID=A0A060R5Z0_9BACT|nr:Cobalt-zinc-cadmium resistance protein CzcA/Cation efflux system protein CusA [Mucinivorans hirudinis]